MVQQTSDQTERFWFSGDVSGGKVFSADLIESFEKSIDLSPEDQSILDEIKGSLKKEKKMPFRWTKQEHNYIESHPQEKWISYLIYRYKFKIFPKAKKVAEFPVYLLIEPTSVCNLRCVMCFQIDETFTQKPYMGMMDLDLYKRIIDEAEHGGTKAITMASRGEPTLHKDFGEILRYASEKFIDFKINTNATMLTEERCHEILLSGVNELVFSVDGHNKAIYEEIRVRSNFDEVLKNIDLFHTIREKQYQGSKLNTRASAVLFRDDQDESEFQKFWSGITDEVAYAVVRFQWDTYNNAVHPDRNEPCEFLWERMYIWFDGTVNPCEMDYKSHLQTGNVNDSSIRDVWKSDKYEKFREAHLEGNRGRLMPCDRCGV